MDGTVRRYLGVLAGDTNGDRVTNIFDLIAIRNALNQPVTAANFRVDIDANGAINVFDLISVRNNLNRTVDCAPIPPAIISAVMAGGNTHVDITMSEGVYTASNGAGGLVAADFNLTFNQNGGSATNTTVESVTTAVHEQLVGGETVIRVNLSLTGFPSGLETVTITPADGNSIFGAIGNPMSADQTTGPLALNDPEGLAFIPAGEFQMGDPFNEGSTNERPRHGVYLDAFYIDRHEVSNQRYASALNWASAQGNLISVISGVVYKASSGTSYPYCHTATSHFRSGITWNGSEFGTVQGRESRPAVGVSWYGAAAYANWRSAMKGRLTCYDLATWVCDFDVSGYRLPTEAEWEKAARGGGAGHRFPWSAVDTIQHQQANYQSSSSYVYDISLTRGYHPTFKIDADPYVSPVGYFSPDASGLYDMAGNVQEWCNDWYDSKYYSSSPYSRPRGPVTGIRRVLRGGTCVNYPDDVRCAARNSYPPDSIYLYNSIRLVLDAE